MSYIEITTKNGLGRRTVELRDKPLRIGRSHTNDIVLRDTRVSRHHCVIEVVAGRPIIRDLGSVRGIKVNNRRREESDLRPGDRVRIGPFTICLRQDSTDARHTDSSQSPAGSAIADWDASESGSDSDETATPDLAQPLALSHDSRESSHGESESTAAGRAGEAELTARMHRRVEELAEQIAQLERAARQREKTISTLQREIDDLHEDRSEESQSIELPGQHAAMAEEFAARHAELAAHVSERDDRFASLQQRIEELAQLADRLKGIEASMADVPQVVARLESAEQRLHESSQRVDKLAASQEQLAFEHSQVAGAVQEIASRTHQPEEAASLRSVLESRMAAIEEAAQQGTISARLALEEASQLASRFENVAAQSNAVQERLAELLARDAESSARVTVHEELLERGQQQLLEISRTIDEMRRTHQAMHDERSQLQASVQSLREELSLVREWFDGIEQRIAAPRETESLAHAEMRSEMAALRNSLETIGARLSARIERLEGSSADAAPELSALKEQVRRLSDNRSRESAPARPPAVVVTRALSAPASTAVLERPSTPPPLRPPGASGPAGVPASIDAEQQRQVMSRIFQGKEEHDDRYKPARDRSTIVLFVIVLILALGVLLAIVGPMIAKRGEGAGTEFNTPRTQTPLLGRQS